MCGHGYCMWTLRDSIGNGKTHPARSTQQPLLTCIAASRRCRVPPSARSLYEPLFMDRMVRNIGESIRSLASQYLVTDRAAGWSCHCWGHVRQIRLEKLLVALRCHCRICLDISSALSNIVIELTGSPTKAQFSLSGELDNSSPKNIGPALIMLFKLFAYLIVVWSSFVFAWAASMIVIITVTQYKPLQDLHGTCRPLMSDTQTLVPLLELRCLLSFQAL